MECEADARSEAASADRDDHGLRIRELLGELEPDRALSGDHVQVLVGMDEGRSGLLDVREGGGHGFLERLACQLGAGPVVAGRVDLGHRRLGGHEDRGLDPRLAGGPGDGLSVVPRACGHDPGLALRCAQAFDLVDGAADLERARSLEVLGLQVYGAACQPGEGLRAVDRRDADALAGEPPPGGLDVSECWGGLGRQA